MVGDDPHWWQDPARAGMRPRRSAARFPRRAPTPRRTWQRLRALDSGVRACIDAYRGRERKLVTSHDALGYYARRYGIGSVGTVIPSLSTAAQPWRGTSRSWSATIRRTGVKTIFAERSVNPKVEPAIAPESGINVGKELWADSLGPKGADGETYIGSIRPTRTRWSQGFYG